MLPKQIRCAIYTRNSTEENLDMDFNSLDAQRESGEKPTAAILYQPSRLFQHITMARRSFSL